LLSVLLASCAAAAPGGIEVRVLSGRADMVTGGDALVETNAAPEKFSATLNGPAGKRLAPFMSEIVEVLERVGELEVDPEVRAKLVRMSAATIDRAAAEATVAVPLTRSVIS